MLNALKINAEAGYRSRTCFFINLSSPGFEKPFFQGFPGPYSDGNSGTL